MNGDNGTSAPHNAQLRALLFTDLCDSLQLVERIGDVAAAEFFQQHDRLVLGLQQHWNGQLIDRSDGLFVLFERPIDGIGFAISYQNAVDAMGHERGIVLRARAGLHVGDVLLWDNSAEAVAHGAKAVEVEGLAKPMAARLMQLAWPGQVLLSSAAEQMARRADSELPWAADELRWKDHGLWRFKGIGERQHVFEVGIRGRAPLRRPRSGDKAWRDLPLWRRPAALFTEATLAVALAVVMWTLLRPAPAIAFAERDWVILAAVSNSTAYPQLDSSLEQALYISLGQSRFVNILSELKVRDTLQLMQRPANARLDRALAIEVALRDGARAVLMPTVLELNGKVRVGVEVVDPRTGQTVYTHFADGNGLDSILASTDTVVKALRSDLGEALHDVSREQKPLPTVATANLDALHAYSKGNDALLLGHFDDALLFFQQATRLDPQFTFAYIGQMRLQYAMGNVSVAGDLYRQAMSGRTRLSARDQLYLDAWGADFSGAAPQRSAEKWRMLTQLYPDDPAGWMNYSMSQFGCGDYDGALAAAMPLLERHQAQRSLVLSFVGRIQLARGEVKAARAAFQEARTQPGWRGDSLESVALALDGDTELARQRYEEMTSRGFGGRMEHSGLLALQGKSADAAIDMRQAVEQCGSVPELCDILALQAVAWGAQADGTLSKPELTRLLDRAIAVADEGTGAAPRHRAFIALSVAYHVLRAGMDSELQRRQPTLEALVARSNDPRLQELWGIVRARAELEAGNAKAASMLLERVSGGTLYQWHVLRLDIDQALGRDAAVQVKKRWLRQRTGLIFAEDAGGKVLLPLNVADARRLVDDAGLRQAGTP
ncbi:putative peptide modification system cyclase [Stenotrophomonas indicatrix]|uniref:putative peptide modification system cyclase n=1 Tax=Stenotrophomonas indicatrix TaxID=2045451 RepID=UPI0013DA65F8|nr:putative peptide modification system cyclase [Stenotrophomonas indicatrix]